MKCAHENCLCTSEVGIKKDGRVFCSQHCLDGAPHVGKQGCHCGHAGCASPESGTALQ